MSGLVLLSGAVAIGGIIPMATRGEFLPYAIGIAGFALFFNLLQILLIARYFIRSLDRIERDQQELNQKVNQLRQQLADGQMTD